MSNWFTADKDGLRQLHERLVERRGFGIVGAELYANVMDTSATDCLFTIEKFPRQPVIRVRVEDNGEGFHDLSHAWTIFAPSKKKLDPEKAGRFNLGEKVVLSFALEGEIHTTTGTVKFDSSGRTVNGRKKRSQGTVFEALLRGNQERYEQLLDYMRRVIVRPGLNLTVNGEVVPHRTPIHVFETPLKTEIGEDLRPTVRITKVEVYEPLEGDIPSLFELGIPVVETDDRWHYNVLQKVPLNADRDNVTPAYLRSVRVAVLNEMHNRIQPEDTTTSWVYDATSSPDCSDEAIGTFKLQKYGEKSVAFDPGNPEANNVAAANGFTVIPSRGLTTGQRENLKRAGQLISSSQQFPDAGRRAYMGGPNAKPADIIPESEWTRGMKNIHAYTLFLGRRLLGKPIYVIFVKVGEKWDACYGQGQISSEFHYNVQSLGKKWFDGPVRPEIDELIIHEFGHEYATNHLSEDYYKSLCRLGAKLKALALAHPEDFGPFTGD